MGFRKFLLLVAVIFSYGFNSLSQNAMYEWANISNNASGVDYGYALSVKDVGYLYQVGSFQGTLDFDPGGGTMNLTSNGNYDCYIRKLDANQNLIWAKSFGGLSEDQILDVTRDGSGNVVCVGYFEDSVDFDPGPGVFNLMTPTEAMFVLKLDMNGNFLWAFALDEHTGPTYGTVKLTCDSSDHVYLGGNFFDSIDLDPSINSAVYYGNTQSTGFVSKYDASGNFQWGGILDGGTSFVYDLQIDTLGSLLVTGTFYNTVDFDIGPGVVNNTTVSASNEGYLWKLDANGNYIWSRLYHATASSDGFSLQVDANNDYFLAGRFRGTVDFDPGAGVNNQSSYSANGGLTFQTNMFITKLNDSGSEIWTNTFLGTAQGIPGNIQLGSQGDVYFVGEYFGIYDMDPSSEVFTLFQNGNNDEFFIVKILSNSDFAWAKSLHGQFYARPDVGVDPVSEDVYVLGTMNGSVDLDPGYAIENYNAAFIDFFLLKLSPCVPSGSIDTVYACSTPYQWIDGKNYYSSTTDPKYVLEAANGCDSIISLNLTIGSSNTGTDIITACDSFTWINGTTYTSSNFSATHTLTNVTGCDSVVTLNLTINQSDLVVDVIQSCGPYTWIDGNTYTSSNNTAEVIYTNIQGCDSVVKLNLTVGAANTGTDNIIACDSFTWIDGNTYTSSNNSAQWTITNAQGCDSLVSLDLTILSSTSGTDIATACNSYTWIDGNTYTSSNNSAQWTLINVQGCDSIVTLNLTINSASANVTSDDPELIADPGATSYQWLDCSNGYAAISGATNNSFIPAANGEYAVVIEENGCLDTSACFVINNVGLSTIENQNWKLYPNPTSGHFTLEFQQTPANAMVEITNPLGQRISQQVVSSAEVELILGAQSGVYFVRVISEGWEEVVVVVRK